MNLNESIVENAALSWFNQKNAVRGAWRIVH
jgi:hypothetical protein